jgi:hypothetical protein
VQNVSLLVKNIEARGLDGRSLPEVARASLAYPEMRGSRSVPRLHHTPRCPRLQVSHDPAGGRVGADHHVHVAAAYVGGMQRPRAVATYLLEGCQHDDALRYDEHYGWAPEQSARPFQERVALSAAWFAVPVLLARHRAARVAW